MNVSIPFISLYLPFYSPRLQFKKKKLHNLFASLFVATNISNLTTYCRIVNKGTCTCFGCGRQIALIEPDISIGTSRYFKGCDVK
jgi:hypothetical protein